MLGLFRKNDGSPPVEQLNFIPFLFDLSGNILEISIPDNISPDMPLTERVPGIDLEASNTFKSSNQIPLMKVMYDFSKPGWRKLDYGSMVMTIWLHKKPVSYLGDIFERTNLIKAVQIDLKNNYQAFNDKVWNEGLADGKLSVDLVNEMINFSGNTEEEIIDHKLNERLWVEHFLGGLENHRVYCTSITNSHYVSIDFEDMAASNIHFDEMIEISTPYSNAIMNTAKLSLLLDTRKAITKGITLESPKK